MPPRSVFNPSLRRLIARANSHRRPSPSRSFHAASSLQAPIRKPVPLDVPHPTALSALLSRLSLPPDPALHPSLIACLTHPSYLSSASSSTAASSSLDPSPESATNDIVDTNELHSSLGNSLLGLFASEHLSALYPLLPTEALKSAVTAYVGPRACSSVARELGVAVHAGGNLGQPRQGRGMPSAGVAIRLRRIQDDEDGQDELAGPEKTPVAKRFRKYTGDDGGQGGDVDVGWHRANKNESFEEMVATSVKAFVGLIYQEEGIHAARIFTHAHFLTRHLDLASLFNFKNPKHVLSSIVARHLIDAGVHPSNGMGRVEARLLASTGTNSQSPLFNVGMFTSFGLKLGEGHGSSLKMAEHRAAVNALLAHFLVRGDQNPLTSRVGLPSSVHVDFPVDRVGLVQAVENRYDGLTNGGTETLVESSRARAREGRENGAARTTAL